MGILSLPSIEFSDSVDSNCAVPDLVRFPNKIKIQYSQVYSSVPNKRRAMFINLKDFLKGHTLNWVPFLPF